MNKISFSCVMHFITLEECELKYGIWTSFEKNQARMQSETGGHYMQSLPSQRTRRVNMVESMYFCQHACIVAKVSPSSLVIIDSNEQMQLVIYSSVHADEWLILQVTSF